MFLKIDGIAGESVDSKHKDEIEIQSYSLGSSNPTSFNSRGAGSSTGKVSFQDIHFTKITDKASPNLMLACASGKHIDTAVLSVRKAGENPVDFLKITFTDLLVSSFQTNGSRSGDTPTESISLSFGKIQFAYSQQNADGTLLSPILGAWDLKLNTSINPNLTTG